MLRRLKVSFCRHREQYPRRVGTHTFWQCARCDLYTAPVIYFQPHYNNRAY